ncbi:unnamed protein product [Ranitomeya imitator]|uniref:Occludin n=1 Tax=Ranitomeya imitator TaxID=111125 RepID=A0ABN9L547_9NEOB|nr:unnamed protein product [Ranitomeya imitator]
MSSKPFESPPPYRPDEYKPSIYAPSQDLYGGKMPSQPAYSYYPEDEVQHFYRWSSPPGIIKIMSILIVVMCVGIFACVASTLPWDLDITGQSMGYGLGGYSGYSGAYNGYGFGSSQGGYGFAYGGNYTDPRAAKGFILAMAAFCFICGMAIAIVLGFLIVVAFAIIIFFSVKTRRKINSYGKSNILWRKTPSEEQGVPNVEEWHEIKFLEICPVGASINRYLLNQMPALSIITCSSCGSVSSTDAQQRARTDYVTAPSNLSVTARGRWRRSRTGARSSPTSAEKKIADEMSPIE